MGILIGGPTPQDGKSAYELAQDLGYVGTLTQWLQSLVGAQGPQGIPGSPGVGTAGPVGVGVQTATVDGNGDLLVTLTNGAINNAGHVVGPQGPAGSGGGTGSALGVTPYSWGFGDPGYTAVTGGVGGYVKIGSMVICSGKVSGGSGKFKLPFTAANTFMFTLYDPIGGNHKQVTVYAGTSETVSIVPIGTDKSFDFNYLN